MSETQGAELLREAAVAIRKDWQDEDCSGSGRAYNLAVADWLEQEARGVDAGRLAVVHGGAPMFPASPASLAVARAYLGRSS